MTPAAMQTRHNRSYRRIHDLGNLLVGETFDVGEIDSETTIFRQLGQSAPNLRIRQIFNVETIQSDSFMRGGDYASDVAPTIDDIRSYETIHKAQVRDARISEEVDRLLSEGIITGSRENWINVFRKNDVVP